MWELLNSVSEAAVALESGLHVQSRKLTPPSEWEDVRPDYVALYRDRAYRCRPRTHVLFGVEFLPVKVVPTLHRPPVIPEYYYPDFSHRLITRFQPPTLLPGKDTSDIKNLAFLNADGDEDLGSRHAYELGLVLSDREQAKQLLDGFRSTVLTRVGLTKP